MGIDCRRKNFPIVGGGAHEGGAWIVAGDGSVKLSFTDLQIDQLEENERQDADVNCPNQHQAFAPFSSARATQSLVTPGLGKQIETGWRRWRFDPNEIGTSSERTLHFFPQLETPFIQ